MADWTTRARVKRHLNLADDNTDLDDKIDDLIPAASLMLEKYIGRTLFEATYTEYQDGDGSNEILLNNYPVTSITSINDDPTRVFGADTVVPVTDCVFDSASEQNVGWLRIFQGNGAFQTGIMNVKVVYLAGYATLPDDAEMACVQLVAWLLNRAGTEGQTSAALGGKSETYEIDSIPSYIKRQVAAYKKYSA